MKLTYQRKQVFMLFNELLVIAFMVYQYFKNLDSNTSSMMPLWIISITVVGAAYIEFSNLKGSCVLYQFSDLLVFISWIFLLFQSDEKLFFQLAMVLYVFLPYKLVCFSLMFIFQDTAYTYKKQIDIILKLSCGLAVVSLVNKRLFSLMFMLQCIISFSCFLFVIWKHRKRVVFVIKQEKKNLIYSLALTVILYVPYILIFREKSAYMDNIGLYIIVTIPLFSIYGIIKKTRHELNDYALLNYKKKIILSTSLVSSVAIIGWVLNFNIISFFILGHCFVWLALLYFTLVYSEIKSNNGNHNTRNMERMQKNFYMHSINQIAREEAIKKDFSNYLHDEVLQDILSIKNMIQKADKPQVRELIVQTLDNLNNTIREQMQEYHPTLLQTLTLKENFNNLIEMIKQTYPMKEITTLFTCDDDIFLVEPYNLIFYRILKELVNNAFKHAECNHIWVCLSQNKGEIELIVEDDGVGFRVKAGVNTSAHKGLASIREQVHLLGGKMTMMPRNTSGLRIQIQISMKGEDSYKHFINR